MYHLVITRFASNCSPRIETQDFKTLEEARKALQTERRFVLGEALLEVYTDDKGLMISSSLHNYPR